MIRMSRYDISKKAIGFVPATQRQACRNCAGKTTDVVGGKQLALCKPGGFFVTDMAVCSEWTALATATPSTPRVLEAA